VNEKRWVLVFFLLLAAGLYIANHGAYRGYFQDDDLDNLTFTQDLSLGDFLTPMVWPRVFDNNFRPVGHLLYREMARAVGLNYTPYIVLIQVLHFVNCILLWLVLRKLDVPPLAAGAGVLFWAFHMAAFDIFWKFMYVFDLFCGLFCLLAVLAYLNDRWVLSLLAMWLGYRSKEVAIMLPVVLALYEGLLGQRRWKRLIPFFALSLILGVQAMWQNHGRAENAYTLHLDPASMWKCIRFYTGRVVLIPYAGLALLALLALVKDRRVWFGIAGFCALLVPMLLLPGRLFSPYMYVPLIGLAVAVAALLAKQRKAVVAIALAIWLPWMYVNLKRDRRATLADSLDRRTYMSRLLEYAKANPTVLSFVASPGPWNSYGTKGAILMAHPPGTRIRFALLDSPGWQDVLTSQSGALLNWDRTKHDLGILTKMSGTPDASYIKMGMTTPVWQLGQGWYEDEGLFRWIAPEATAKLGRPAEAKQFELVVNAGPELLAKIHASTVRIALNGVEVGSQEFAQPGIRKVRWDLQAGPAGQVEVGFHVSPEYRSPRPLGIAIVSFGFVE
jgi:hypothetical protein